LSVVAVAVGCCDWDTGEDEDEDDGGDAGGKGKSCCLFHGEINAVGTFGTTTVVFRSLSLYMFFSLLVKQR
jgi:hypothetical protein